MLCLTIFIWGCDDYERTGVEESIYINKSSLSMFVGDQNQLTVSPTGGTYNWESEDPSVATVTNGLVEAVGEGTTNIVASNGTIQTKVSVNAVIRIPLTGVSLSEYYIEMSPGDVKNILITLIPEDANDIPGSAWTSENIDIATVTDAGEITAIAHGVTNVIFRIGDFEKVIVIDISKTRPFNGPHVLSAMAQCLINAADFDLGGAENAFHDNASGDSSGQGGNYRRQGGDTQSDDVDVEGLGLNVGWTGPGEWLLYTVNVEDEGEYLLEVQTAVPGSGSFHLEVDGVNVTNTVAVPNTGGWGTFVWNPIPGIPINLTSGKHLIKYYFEGGHNFRAFRFTFNQ